MTDPSIASDAEPPRLPLTDEVVEPEPERPAMRRLFLTSDLRAATGLPRTHMDFYLREGIIQPTARTESGYLLFDERELDILRTVLRWRQHGIGIREIRQRLGRDDR